MLGIVDAIEVWRLPVGHTHEVSFLSISVFPSLDHPSYLPNRSTLTHTFYLSSSYHVYHGML